MLEAQKGRAPEGIGHLPSQGQHPYETVLAFCGLFREELDYRGSHSLEVQVLQRQYRRILFLPDGGPSYLGVYGYATRLAPVLQSIREVGPGVRLLDAGCGCGTESLLFALAGASVTGVDQIPQRIELARSRLCFYQGRASKPLAVDFFSADVLQYLEAGRSFDIIWAMESVSHIHPTEVLLPLVYRSLAPNGLFITSDPNASNPLVLYRAYRIRGHPRYTLRSTAEDPRTGKPRYEAWERIFSVRDYTRRLLTAGFETSQVTMSGFMASSFVPLPLHRSKSILTLLAWQQRLLQVLPILRLMGTIYTVVARKAADKDILSHPQDG